MKRTLITLASLFMACTAAAAHDDAALKHRTLLGFVEWVTLEPSGLHLKARLDTGAKTSSLHGLEPEEFERDGEDWVRFKLPLEHRKDDAPQLVLERPVERVVLVKRKGAPPQRRYVVQLPLCLDGTSYQAEFSLTDRSGFIYPVLLGREFLREVAVVDPAESFIASRACEHKSLEELAQALAESDGGKLHSEQESTE